MDFSALSAYLDEVTARGVPGYALILRLGRETVFEKRCGCAPDGLFWFYSATKLFTCTAAARLLERGLIGLDDPVSRWLPEYGGLRVREADGSLRPAGTELLIRHLFTMSGGLTYDIASPEIRSARDRSTRGIVKAIAAMPLTFDPGAGYQYSLCHDVLAAVVETAAGRRFADFVREEICQPLGMKDMSFHPTEEQLGRLEPQYAWQKDRAVPCPPVNHFCFSPEYDSGGAGLCGSAGDYILLSEALANGGTGRDGYPLLKPETVRLMGTNHLPPEPLRDFRTAWGRFASYGYGLGVRVRMDHADGSRSPAGEFGWDGAAGAYTLVDTGRQLSAVYVQHVLNMLPVYEEIHPQLRELIFAGLE